MPEVGQPSPVPQFLLGSTQNPDWTALKSGMDEASSPTFKRLSRQKCIFLLGHGAWPLAGRKYGNMGNMKTTIEIPDPLFRKAKSKAAENGQTLKELVTEALQEKLGSKADKPRATEPEWMRGFGKLRRLRKETKRIQARIDRAFEVIEPEDRA
jgi:hypothetical protein